MIDGIFGPRRSGILLIAIEAAVSGHNVIKSMKRAGSVYLNQLPGAVSTSSIDTSIESII